MLWFIKQHVFSFIKMKQLFIALPEWNGDTACPDHAIEGKPLDCRIISNLDTALEPMFVESLARMESKPYFSLSDIHTRLQMGHVLSIAMIDNRIVGWTWSAMGNIHYSEFNALIKLRPGEAFSYNTYVHKQHRGKRINQYLLNNMLSYLKQRKRTKLWALIYPWNTASLNSYLKNGWKIEKDYYFLKLFGLNFHFLKDVN